MSDDLLRFNESASYQSRWRLINTRKDIHHARRIIFLSKSAIGEAQLFSRAMIELS